MGAFLFLCFVCLSVYYGFSRPTTEQPGVGRTHPLDVHGHVAYLTYREIFTLHILQVTGIGLFFVGAMVALVIKMQERRIAQNQFRE